MSTCAEPCDHLFEAATLSAQLVEALDDAAAVRAYATRLEAALVKAHACATVRDDGECEGCFVSEALATCPAESARGSQPERR